MKGSIFAVLLAGSTLIGCDGSEPKDRPWAKAEVEVAPGVFIILQERYSSPDDRKANPVHVPRAFEQKSTETTELRIPWQGADIHWKGNSLPLNLRIYDDKFYLITFDRVAGRPNCLFRYYGQEGQAMKEISRTNFPRAIAGQNLGFYHRYFSCGDNPRRDHVQIALDTEPHDVCFRSSITAYIWAHLATGEQYEESLKRWEIGKALLEQFISTNSPIKLTTIIRSEQRKHPQQATKEF